MMNSNEVRQVMCTIPQRKGFQTKSILKIRYVYTCRLHEKKPTHLNLFGKFRNGDTRLPMETGITKYTKRM